MTYSKGIIIVKGPYGTSVQLRPVAQMDGKTLYTVKSHSRHISASWLPLKESEAIAVEYLQTTGAR